MLQVALADPEAERGDAPRRLPGGAGLGQQQERLIDALLTLARGERGVERREPFDLAEVAAAGGRRPPRRGRAPGARLPAALAAAPATGDPSLAESLVANLVDNALRHNVAPAAGPRSRPAIGRAGRRSSVRNSGPVIPPGEVDRLFQPFQRLGGERVAPVRGRGGHGLGLAIVRAIADAHGADLAARARPEGGLDITVIFPPRS